ncbi:autotransporter outer membrane beta-barrel domain-containing protein [Acuticoccus sp. M5D2P5]|uniref:autotransporter outer membrane beta-barrel domain-containing protein n=1 Tax=Acuticoccus kalidii TaxID=2910977 RepID=UPI001F3519FD|nr:autotransporter outer membrane beta-barrel domain-containing protein [Acuticoccus kalidii]MCF3933274.1 autotransporter outer membrane beta-barrel domain-containing protein [Acuticoccus kalidii]
MGGFAATPLYAQDCRTSTDQGLRVELCSGDLSGGVTRLRNTVDRLNIVGLDGTVTPRAPADPTFGVRGAGPKQVFVDGSARGVIVSRGGAGLEVSSIGFNGAAGTDTAGEGRRGFTGGGAGIARVDLSGGVSVQPAGTGFLARSIGGAGGRGGTSQTILDEIRPGAGGDGGSGGTAVIDVARGTHGTGAAVGPIVQATSEGGAGGVGGAARGEVAVLGAAGGRGGAAGTVSVTISNAEIVAGEAARLILSESRGGAGGAGTSVITGRLPSRRLGGNGGAGGAAGPARLSMMSGRLSAPSVTGGSLVEVVSWGGAGGAGGYSLGDAGSRTGAGGAGGTGGAADISLDGVAIGGPGQSVMRLNRGSVLLAQSRGGDGGVSGLADTLTGIARGNEGGHGGAAGTARITLDGVTIRAAGVAVNNETFGVLAGAVGGNAGRAASSNDGRGDRGGAGGAGALARVEMVNTTVALERALTAVEAASAGQNGGAGGNARAFSDLATGGAGGGGGAGGRAEVALTGGAVTLSDRGRAAVRASSNGGSGGRGGNANNGVVLGAPTTGGDGGVGGQGGAVSAELLGGIRVVAEAAIGIDAMSTGGRGGDGGTASTALVGGATAGRGGAGGAGGAVAVTLEGSVATSGGDGGRPAFGISARSLGGAGGPAAPARTLFGGATGGAGGGSGAGGAVSVRASGTVATGGAGAHAIFAQSVGGFAGNASGGSGYLGFGASAESAGDGGAVTVVLGGTDTRISTGARDASGLYAQSVGGGGGVAGAGSGAVAIGGTGSSGGNGGAVSAIFGGGAVETAGADATAVFLQSIGGGGGDGSRAIGYGTLIGISLGGAGGRGGAGGTISVADSGGAPAALVTRGDIARGLALQSVGGGGGEGGNAITGAGVNVVNAAIALGGRGGQGGAGGSLAVNTAATVSTAGRLATGVELLSVGGGGGTSGTTVAASGLTLLNVGVALGGAGGDGGAGGRVDATLRGRVGTRGDGATGISAQSIGGGGGRSGDVFNATALNTLSVAVTVGGGGGRGGSGGHVTLRSDGGVATTGSDATGLEALSIGGGGGSTGLTVTADAASLQSAAVTVGGSGGVAGRGGAVEVIATGVVTTEGSGARGILASSIGGGGGVSNATVAGTGIALLGNVGVAVGGSGGAGGEAGAVNVSARRDVTTRGSNAGAIVASSIGGGGGSAGMTIAGTAQSPVAANVTVGGAGGGGATAGAVTVVTSGTVSTAGHNSAGISAMSVGGGGGDTGMTMSGSGITGASIPVTVGQDAGRGGTAGNVSVTTRSVSTLGRNSPGILASSTGGGGGSAGSVVSVPLLQLATVPVAVGGAGGAGGTAGNVAARLESGRVSTANSFSAGIVAQSIGGNGGTGGSALQGSISASPAANIPSGSIAVVVGGAGGAGGEGGRVNLISLGAVRTAGLVSPGLVAQSIGGNGGIGGSVTTGNISFTGGTSGQLGVTVGGSGGAGAKASGVIVNSRQTIVTEGDLSDGIVAQSIGGNGGIGGAVSSLNGGFRNGSSIGIQVNVGGAGGRGALGDRVDVSNTARISTAGKESRGIHAQSIGGGGGIGGAASSFALDLNQLLGIWEELRPATGGSSATESADISLDARVNVGGTGGAGGHAGAVFVQNEGAGIVTAGVGAQAIAATSIGGGGGAGGTASHDSFEVPELCELGGMVLGGGKGLLCNVRTVSKIIDGSFEFEPEFDVTVNVGGAGGVAGNGNTARVRNSAPLTTSGDVAHGIFVQSIGGGGGHGGNGAAEQSVLESIDEDAAAFWEGVQDGFIATATKEGILGLSVDGPTFDLLKVFNEFEVGIGGRAGASGDGGAVTVWNSGAITTTGDQAHAIYAQSIGGGGGTGGMGVNGTIGVFNVGGMGSGGGTGGAVTIETSGAIRTSGLGSAGIFAQSVGGGGGVAGDVGGVWAITYENRDALYRTEALIGAYRPGGGGDGGAIDIVSTGRILTEGDLAHGIIAQSIGGSGGIAADDDDPGERTTAILTAPTVFAASRGDRGRGGNIAIEATGGIITYGADASGIIAQSQAGANSRSGIVSITTGDISIRGTGGRAIFAMSGVEAAGRGAFASPETKPDGGVAIHVRKGATVETVDSAETILILGGDESAAVANRITNLGTIANHSDKAGRYVIRTDGAANLVIENKGTITGSILIGDEAKDTAAPLARHAAGGIPARQRSAPQRSARLINSGTLALGSVADLGDKGVLRNSGHVTVGGGEAIARTRIIGDFVQSAGGLLEIDASLPAGEADILTVDGEIRLDGTLAIVSDGLLPYEGETRKIVILRGDVVSNEAEIVDTAAIDYETRTVEGGPRRDRVILSYKVDFTPFDDDEPADDAIGNYGEYINSLVEARRMATAQGSDAFAFVDDLVLGILSEPDAAALAANYDRAVPDEVFAVSEAVVLGGVAFANQLMTCPAITDGLAVSAEDGSCAWASLGGQAAARDGSANQGGYDEKTFGFNAGFQTEVADDWFLGASASITGSWLDGDRDMDANGTRAAFGVVARREIGATTLSAALSGGHAWYETRRPAPVPGGTALGKADLTGWWIAANARAAHRFEMGGGVFLSPTVDVGVQHWRQNAYDETGAGAYGLSFGAIEETAVTLNPFLEAGVGFALPSGAGELKVRAGVLAFLGNDSYGTTVRYVGQGGAGPAFDLDQKLDPVFADLGVALSAKIADSVSVSLGANALLSSDYRSLSARAGIDIAF